MSATGRVEWPPAGRFSWPLTDNVGHEGSMLAAAKEAQPRRRGGLHHLRQIAATGDCGPMHGDIGRFASNRRDPARLRCWVRDRGGQPGSIAIPLLQPSLRHRD